MVNRARVDSFQFSKFPNFSRFPTSLKHRREKKQFALRPKERTLKTILERREPRSLSGYNRCITSRHVNYLVGVFLFVSGPRALGQECEQRGIPMLRPYVSGRCASQPVVMPSINFMGIGIERKYQ